MSCIDKCEAEDRLCEICLTEIRTLRETVARAYALAERWETNPSASIRMAGATLYANLKGDRG